MRILKEVPILHINTAKSWRGGEKQTFNLIYHLCRMGYRCFCICRPDSPLHVKLLEDNLPHFAVRMRSEFDIISAKKISGIAKKLSVKILHMHTAHAHSLGYMSNFFYKIPVNIVARRVDFHISKNLFSRMKYNYPEQYITVSGAIWNILVEDGIAPGKIKTVYSGVNPDDYNNIGTDYLNKEFGYIPELDNKVILVNTAALTHQKDHETLLKAAYLLKKEFANFVLFIAGEGELRNKLLKLHAGLSLNENVVFTGFRNDVLNLISYSDIFVMSSRWEGLGTSIADAMSMKKPVVATNTGGIPELIRDRHNGLVVKKENPEDLARAMLELILDKALQKKLSQNAFNTVRNFTIEKTVWETINVYEELSGVYL